jgi:hypothetical protein
MGKFSIPRNFNGVQSIEGIQFQLGESLAKVEDYLNSRVDIYILDSKTKNQLRPTFKKGDVVFDFTIKPGVATLQQWNGQKLIPLDVGTEPGTGGSGDSAVEFLAAELIPAFSLGTADGHIASSANLGQFNKVIGMVREDVPSGAIGLAVVDEEVTNPAWSWSPGSKLFLNGTALSVTPPATGFSQMVAVARNAQIIIMKISQAVLL